MRGFLGGVSAGALLAAGGLAMLSLSVPLPDLASGPQTGGEPAESPAEQAVEPAAHNPGAAPELPNGEGGTAEAPGGSQVRDADLAEAQPAVPASAGGTDNLADLAGADTAPADKPQVGLDGVADGAESPETAEAPGIAPAESESSPQLADPSAPEAPEAESAVVAATEPAAPPQAGSGGSEQGLSSGSKAELETGETAGLPATTAVTAPEIGSAPEATTLPVIGQAPAVPIAEGGTSSGISETETAEGTAGDETQQPLAPTIGTRVIPLTERDDAKEQEQVLAARPSENPFIANAVPFDPPEDRALMSIVLIDGIGAVGAEALAEFPYPLSFAIDPEDPEATAKAEARRKAGFEVLLMADLPREASPQDAETALEVWRGKIPQAVAILEGVETGVQGNRQLADQVSAMAASAGYGLVTQNSGLNTVQKLAVRDGVPAGVVFRDFDGAGQDPRAIRRFLDQAAFRAGQEGAVIMLGRLRPDTISALLIWGLQDRASRVSLAPVSTSLKAQLPE